MNLFALVLALAWLGQGCLAMPLPASGKKVSCGSRICPEETAFVQAKRTTRSEITARLGQPFLTLASTSAVAYNWTVVVGYWYGVCLAGGPGLAFGREPIERNEVLMLEFDSDNHVRRFEFAHLPGDSSVEDFLQKWVGQPPSQKDKL